MGMVQLGDEVKVEARLTTADLDVLHIGMEMDFVVDGDAHSTHMLNAVSPAWTHSCSSVYLTVMMFPVEVENEKGRRVDAQAQACGPR